MHKTVVLNVVGLTPSLLGPSTPRLSAFAAQGQIAFIKPVLPAVTCTVQSTYLTGTLPSEHGIVGNGWYFRDECEIKFWKQSNPLVQRPKIWERAKLIDPTFTCANICWWYAMYSSADYAITPRPMYPSDGRKLPDCWTHPGELRSMLQTKLGQFPLFQFWGPATSIRATQWIADAAIEVDRLYNPTLTLVYLPHLDYGLQRVGPDPAALSSDLREVDVVCGQLIDHFTARGARVVILSEYGIVPVSRPVHLNRVLRQSGLISVREEVGRELLDAGESAAFAVADHQLAHVYVNDTSKLEHVKTLLKSTPGVARVLDEAGKREMGLDHPRSGELVALAEPDAWFTYYYWLKDERMPDYARTVDIHRKPGYDPAELFIDPKLIAPKAKIVGTLVRKKLGFRTMMNVIPPYAELVKGSHGLKTMNDAGPLLMTKQTSFVTSQEIAATDVFQTLMRHLTDPAN